MYREHLYSSFHQLAVLKATREVDRLALEEWNDYVLAGDWDRNGGRDPYFDDREAIFRNSDKLSKVGQICENHKEQTDRGSQLVFTSSLHVGTYLVYLVSLKSSSKLPRY